MVPMPLYSQVPIQVFRNQIVIPDKVERIEIRRFLGYVQNVLISSKARLNAVNNSIDIFWESKDNRALSISFLQVSPKLFFTVVFGLFITAHMYM
jgi:hypothetical protein